MSDWFDALAEVLAKWEGTPYMAGQALVGEGADCVGFGAAVYDELHDYGPDTPPLRRHAQDLSEHKPKEAARISIEISNRWPHKVIQPGEILEPGDALIARVGKAPGHMMIIGPRPSTVWHADPVAERVCYTGFGAVSNKIVRAWRSTCREHWTTYARSKWTQSLR